MAKKLQFRKVNLEVWECWVFIFWDCTLQEAGTYMKKHYKGMPESILKNIMAPRECQGACFHEQGQSSQVIWLSKKPSSARGAAILAHEAIHAMAHIMRHWGMDINYDTEEVLTSGVSLIIDKTLRK